MAQREASVRLTLDDGDYLVQLRKAGDEGEKAGRRGQKGMDLFGAGIKGVKSQLSGLRDTAGKALGLVTGLAAGFSVGSAIKGAVALDSKFKTLAFRVQVATGELTKSTTIQAMAEQAAIRTGRTTGEMADAFDKVFSATKNLEFSRDVLDAIGTTATGTGENVETVATIAQQLQRKFGLAANEVGDALAQIFEGAQQGGPAFTDFAAKLDLVGAELLQAGVTGKRGLGFLIGALNQADAESGGLEKQVAGIQALFTKLGNPKQLQAMAKAMHVDPQKFINEKDSIKRLNLFLRHGKRGLDALRATFVGPEESKALRILFTDPFETALKEAQDSGLKGKNAIDQAMNVLEERIGNFGKASTTAATLQEQAAKRMQDPQARLSQAMEALERSFAQPEIIQAIDELAQSLPNLAKIVGQVAKFSAGSPLLAGGLFLGAQAGLGLAKGAAGNFIQTAATPALEKAGKAKFGGRAVGNIAGGAGALGAVAVAGLIGKELIDLVAESNAAATSELSAAGAGAAGKRGSLKAQQAQAERLRTAIAQAEEEQGGFGGALSRGFGAVAGFVAGDKNLNLHAQRQKQIEEMKAILAEKDARIAAMTAAGGAPAGGGAAFGTPEKPGTVQVDPKSSAAQGKATAEALAAGKPIKVLVQNQQPMPGRPSSSGASRGPSSPAPAQPGGGV